MRQTRLRMNSTTPAIVPSGFRGLIGAARQDITPPIGIFARNWGAASHDAAEGIHRQLTLTCLTFQAEPDSAPLVLIGADLGWWRNREDEWALRGAILETFNLDESRLMFCLAHTHAGPGLQRADADRPGGHLIGPYLDHLRHSAIRAVRAALSGACPATLTWRYGRCDLAVNRDLPEPGQGKRIVVGYNPWLAADDTLLVGRITLDGPDRTLATIVNYACHPTTLAWENRLISPDYVGAMRELVESATAAPCLFLQGASGELAPAEQYTADVAVADRHGRRLGHAVLATLEAMQRPGKALAFQRVVESGAALAVWNQVETNLSSALAAEMHQVEFHLKPLPPLAEIQRQWRQTSDPVHKERLARKLGVRRFVGDGATTSMPLWLWRLGDSLLLGQANEAYSKLQLDLRARFAPRALAVMNLVNGSLGYLAPAHCYDGPELYQVWQSPFQRGSLEQLIAAATAAAERLLC
ncbi:hypothetical protein [Fontivita pretiosa]|uniref:hypothetical protein n=1 Tax=Fontivita pretiosa TaxID=2989684 RepID=UPI003D186009